MGPQLPFGCSSSDGGAANAAAAVPTNIVSANISATNMVEMRFLIIASHLLSLYPRRKPAHFLFFGGCSRLRYWLCPSLKRPSYGGELLSLYIIRVSCSLLLYLYRENLKHAEKLQ